MASKNVSSGVEHLDKLIGSLNIGDNVVWQVETGAFVELFNRSFIRESLKEGKEVVLVNFNNSPRNILAKLGPVANNPKVTMIDCFTSGKGENGRIFLELYQSTYPKYKCKVIHVQRPSNVADFINLINRIEETHPRGTRYIFDSITGMQDLWGGDEQILKFFTRQCPRLYELDTIAYWILEKNAHSEQFRAQINHITQVVLDLSIENGVCNLVIVKAENRFGGEILKSHRYEVVNSNIEFLEDQEAAIENIGRRIRDIRLKKEISQAQLASEVGVTPSTISQAENNAIRLSLPALLRLARALNVSVGALLDEKPAQSSQFLLRAKNRPAPAEADRLKDKGITFSSVVPPDYENRVEAYVITLAPGSRLDRHFFSYKGDEFGLAMSGSVELEMHSRTYTLNEGDAVYFTSGVPSRWENTSEEPAKLLWVVVK